MKKILIGFLGAAVFMSAAFFLVRYWIQAGTAAETAYCLYASGAENALDYDDVAKKLNDVGIDTAVENVPKDVLSTAEDCLNRGATVLVIGLDEVPADDSLLKLADSKKADLFFVGTYPGSEYMSRYDKAYYIGSHAELGGELAGKAAAMIYRNGVIADQTDNALLDYLFIDYTTDTEKTLLRYSLSECEHYGVYSESALTPHALADSSASSEAGTSLEQELGLTTGAAASEAGVIADYSALSENAAALHSQWYDLEYQPELIYCFSAEAFSYAKEYAKASGWAGRISPVQYICFTQSAAEAALANKAGCETVVYYDVDVVSNDVVQMIQNLVQQSYLAESTGQVLDEDNSLWVPYQLYSSAENDPPAPVAEEEPADSAVSSESTS